MQLYVARHSGLEQPDTPGVSMLGGRQALFKGKQSPLVTKLFLPR